MHTVDEKGDKTIVLDPDLAPFMSKMCELYATGNYSLGKLKDELTALGAGTAKGKPFAISLLNKLLKKAFYFGKRSIEGYHSKPHKTKAKPFILKGMITQYLKEIHQSESKFHREGMMALRKEQDKIQRRISQIYDDKLDGLIDEQMYLEKIREYKTRQTEILEEMKRHEVADQNFYVTANIILKLAAQARELFESSEVEEKRQLLNFVFQNCFY